MNKSKFPFSITIFLLFLFGSHFSSLSQSISSNVIKNRLENVEQGQHIKIMGERLFSSVLVPSFYTNRNFEPAWIAGPNDIDRASMFIAEIEGMQWHGLQAEDYHFKTIRRAFARLASDMREGTESPLSIAELDILFTDAFFMMSSHLYQGKVNPEKINAEWKIQRRRPDLNMDEQLEIMLSQGLTPNQMLKKFYPQNTLYPAMMASLREFRLRERLPKMEEIRAKETIRPDSISDVVPSIRQRLVIMGLLKPYNYREQFLYDEQMQEGIKKLQKQHGLNQDAIIGVGTLALLNLPNEDLVKSLEINLERMRWLPWDFGQKFIVCNIADQSVFMIQDKDTVFSTRAIVGREYRSTPVFEAKMDHLVFSPTWTIPPTILANDVIPAVKKDINYLSSKNMQVLDYSGKPVSANSIDWSNVSGRNFPYMIRQAPGPANALGLVKFMFPNSYNVYIHDTPSRELFSRDNRALSSGCIRIQNPAELAEILLKDLNWDQTKIKAAMNLGREQIVRLPEPIPVFIGYLTVWTDQQGQTHFRNDLYNRDKKLYEAIVSKP
ncbi:murein L,D-transpeptidase [Fulvivirgaceae bacterium LMO-SS25]